MLKLTMALYPTASVGVSETSAPLHTSAVQSTEVSFEVFRVSKSMGLRLRDAEGAVLLCRAGGPG